MLGQFYYDNVSPKIEINCYSFLWQKIWKNIYLDKTGYMEWEMRQIIWQDFYNIVGFNNDNICEQVLQGLKANVKK